MATAASPVRALALPRKRMLANTARSWKAESKLIPVKEDTSVVPALSTLREWTESENWWQWNKCRYLRGQLARSDENKPAVSRRYGDDALRELKRWILPYHGDKRFDEITRRTVRHSALPRKKRAFQRRAFITKPSTERIVLSEAQRLKVIKENPRIRVKGFKPGKHAKGVLTPDEAWKLLNPSTVETVWKGNQVYYSASLLAAVTGIRSGEVLALKRSDIFPDHVHVAGSWDYAYGLGKTKTKRVDDIPNPRFVYHTTDS